MVVSSGIPEDVMKIRAVIMYGHQCARCGHEWESEHPHPRQCPKCWARRWEAKEADTKPGPDEALKSAT